MKTVADKAVKGACSGFWAPSWESLRLVLIQSSREILALILGCRYAKDRGPKVGNMDRKKIGRRTNLVRTSRHSS